MLEIKKSTFWKKKSSCENAEIREKNNYVQEMVLSFFKKDLHPCLGANSVMKNNTYAFDIFEKLGEKESAILTCKSLYKFLKERPLDHYPKLYSFFAVFETSHFNSELDFEKELWKHLTYIHEYDKEHYGWDPNVSSNPEDANFSFSIGGKGFYVVGMHPNSSRSARKFPKVMLVFNLHEQFEMLREKGKYDKMRDAIRLRDKKINGSVNPMLDDFGFVSEVKQYSGRQVDKNWKCPFST